MFLMAPSRELRGKPAAPGLAFGRLVRLDAATGQRISTGDESAERLALERAIGAAIDDLEALRARSEDADGIEMLAFQVAMLGDDSLRAPALVAIAEGTAAEPAWSSALAVQIADYEASEDDYFRARASDLRDLRDRVLGHLTGAERGASRWWSVLAPPSSTDTRRC